MSAATTVQKPSVVSNILRRYSLTLVLLLLFIVASATSDTFMTQGNILNVLNQASIIGVLTVGMTFVILTGGIDLSVGTGVAAVSVYMGLQADAGASTSVILGAGILAGLVLGGVNALAITYGKIVPFIATLAMLSIAKGAALTMSDGTPITVDNDFIASLGQDRWLGIPAGIYVFALVIAIGWVLLNRTAFGRHVVAVGGNSEAARISGINVRRTTIAVYVIAGLCVAVAAILVTGRIGVASPVTGGGYELDAIAAAVIGGAALSGGRGTISGSVQGVLLFAMIFNVFNLHNVSSYTQDILKGVIILVAVLLQRRSNSSTS